MEGFPNKEWKLTWASVENWRQSWVFVWEAYKELNAVHLDNYMTFTQHDNTYGWWIDRETLLVYVFTLLLAKRRLKAGNDNRDKACRRARQINTSQSKGVLDELDLPWLLATYESEGGEARKQKTKKKNTEIYRTG